MDLGLTGRTALITGSWRGTGAGIAQVLAAEGAEVLVHGFEAGQPDEVVESIRVTGGTAIGIVADLRSDDGVEQLQAELGGARVDVLVNNYGTPIGSDWSSMDRWADEWDANVLTAVRPTQALLPAMREAGWGRVVFVGTIGSRRPGKRNPGYYAAKSGLHALVRTLAMETAGSGVTANLVSPGIIATSEMREALTARAGRDGVGPEWSDVERWALEHRMPNLTARIPDPEDIGKVVAFVASEAAWHINGADVAVDGGALDA